MIWYGLRIGVALALGVGVVKTIFGMVFMRSLVNWLSYRAADWHSRRFDERHPGWHEELSGYLNSQTRPDYGKGEQWDRTIHGKPIRKGNQ